MTVAQLGKRQALFTAPAVSSLRHPRTRLTVAGPRLSSDPVAAGNRMSDLTHIRTGLFDWIGRYGQRQEPHPTALCKRPLSELLRATPNHDTDLFDRARWPHAFGDLHDADR